MAYTDIITNNTFAIAMILVLCFSIWKFIIEPIQNEGQPIQNEDVASEE